MYSGAIKPWLTIHGLPLDAIVAIILGEEELEVLFWVLDVSNLIFAIDEITDID